MTTQHHPSNMTEEEHTTRMIKNHECEEFVSQCCGAGRHEYVDTICTQCSDHTGFECIECGVLDGIAAQRGEN